MSIDGAMIEPVWVVPTISWGPCATVRYALNGPTMGTRYAAVFMAPAGSDTGVIAAALQLAVDTVDQQMSNWKPSSDISRFNAAPVGEWVQVARNVIAVIETGLDVGRMSDGRFDIGMGDAVNAWGFGPDLAAPDDAAIALASTARATEIEIDRVNDSLRKVAPLRLDLCAIAKGFGVDELARTLDRFAIADYLVSIDGEVRGRGCRADGLPWQVGIEKPDLTARAIAGSLALSNRAIATSGDYRHRHVHNGRAVSHTIDPRNGRPIDNSLASVSVMAASCMVADAWATALMVAGPELGPALAQANGLDAFFILRQDDALLELAIGAFA